jgi:hypothetical protein
MTGSGHCCRHRGTARRGRRADRYPWRSTPHDQRPPPRSSTNWPAGHSVTLEDGDVAVEVDRARKLSEASSMVPSS